jgi:hypothetical protein
MQEIYKEYGMYLKCGDLREEGNSGQNGDRQNYFEDNNSNNSSDCDERIVADNEEDQEVVAIVITP